MNLMETWSRLLKLAYKWGAVPVVLLIFFGGGWDALRVAQGYKETSGVVTHYSCAKTVTVQFSYTVDDDVHQGSSTLARAGFGCPQYNPGQAVRVFYSTRHPDLALMDTTPQQALRNLVFGIFAVLLLFPVVTFMIAYKEWTS